MVIGIVGVGLLGGSIGYILKKKKWADKVIGIGRNTEKLKKAVEMNAIDEYMTEFGEKTAEIDILILAVPVQLIPEYAVKAAQFMKKGAIITDVGSTKGFISKEISRNIPQWIKFVGGHPMAGSEKTGVEALDPYLFENAVYVLTYDENTDMEALAKVEEMAKMLDANVIKMKSTIHDNAVAAISHVPHIAASALVNSAELIDNENGYALSLAAGGFRDTTRIASGSPEMWRDICVTNSEAIINVTDKYIEELMKFRSAVREKNEAKIYNLFDKGKKTRDLLPKKKKGIISPIFEFVAFVPDKPGVIGDIANILGKNNINIKDIEVLHVRENEGGSIRIGIDIGEESIKALDILREEGYEVKIID